MIMVAKSAAAGYGPAKLWEDMVGNLETAASGLGTKERAAHVCESADPCVKCLAGSGLAAELTDKQVEALFHVAKLRRLARGEVLISEGETDGPLFVVAKGRLDVSRRRPGDSDITLGQLGPGMMVGQLAFLDGSRRTATVTAAADGTSVFEIRRKDIEGTLETDPQLVYRVMRAILRSVAATLDDMNRVFVDSISYIRG